jgi:hypothetical protein
MERGVDMYILFTFSESQGLRVELIFGDIIKSHF